MMRRHLPAILLIFSATVCTGQEMVYTLNQYAPLIYDPTFAATDNDASIAFMNRRTQIGAGVIYQNNIFNGEYPLIDQKTGRRFGGIGLHLLQKDAGSSDLLSTINLGLSLAYNLPLFKNQFLSFGLQTNYHNKATSLESLTSGSQWLADEFRFDPEADLGETIVENRISYFGFNAGLRWYVEDHRLGTHKAFVGITTFNLNKPADSFIQGDSRVPIGMQVAAGALVYHSNRIHVTPQVFYQRDNHNNVVNLLLSNKILFTNENPYDIIHSGNVEILGRYDFNDDLSFGIVFNQPSVSLGFSYNFPLSTNVADQYFRGATEFGIRLLKTIWKPTPKTVTIENTSIGVQRRNFNFSQGQTQPSGQAQKSDMEVIQENIQDLAPVRSVQFHLEKDFHFGFGKAELSAEARLYLDELYKLLEINPDYNIEVVGHTDNVGKHLVNYRLSTLRAEAVATYLKSIGLAEERIKFSGRGDTQPKAPNDTEENRSKNRRVEFIIYVDR